MCIYAFKEIASNYRSLTSTMFVCFLDASKAFDRVNYAKLFQKSSLRGVPCYLIRILVFWYAKQTVMLTCGDVMSVPFHVTNGVRQGGILSPFLFNVYMDELSNRLNGCKTGCLIGELFINHLMYANDLVICCPYHAYSTGLQQMLKVCSEYGVELDVKFNSKKSLIMIIKVKDGRKLSFLSFI